MLLGGSVHVEPSPYARLSIDVAAYRLREYSMVFQRLETYGTSFSTLVGAKGGGVE